MNVNGSEKLSVPSLDRIVDPDWANALKPVENYIRELEVLLREDVTKGKRFLPEGKNVLRAFTYPFQEVKVLIVGQDPYPNPEHATGLAFSVPPGTATPPSLRNIFKELSEDIGCPTPMSGDLTPWVKQGVCLINRVLTVTWGESGSHRGRGWEKVTDQAIRALVNRNKPLVTILWGKQAQELKPLLEDTSLVTSAHPSPLSAHRGFFGSQPFTKTNVLLERQGAQPIQWDAIVTLPGTQPRTF